MKDESRSELRWVLAWAVGIAVLASTPYIWGWWLAPPGYQFLGLTHNIDDGAVYFSWLRQVADGRILFHNLFTSEPTPAGQFNILFLLMGTMAAAGVPLVIVFHVFRVGLGIGLIFVVWQFSKLFLSDSGARRVLIPLVGLSAGIGWLIPAGVMPNAAVDTWQPEAITFLSIYLNPLFLAGLILMIASLHFLVLASRSGQLRHALCAGVSMFLLANIHTYDVLTVAVVWVVSLLALAVKDRRLPARTLGLSLVAAAMAMPPVAYQLYLYHIDPIFRARANSPAPSPAFWFLAAGYGVVLLGAVVGGVLVARFSRKADVAPMPNACLLIVWSIVGFALPYATFAQQRKLVMGLHIPLCILCAFALCAVAARLPMLVGRLAIVAFVLFAAGSNAAFLAKDTSLLTAGRTVTSYLPYISSSELEATSFLARDRDSKIVYAPPTFALFTPALAGRRVYYGHWSETPDYTEKIRAWMEFVDPSLPADYRMEILRQTRADCYVSVGDDTRPPLEFVGSDLRPIFARGDVTIYRVRRR